MRPAFSIIEVLVSVVILSTSIIYILKIHDNQREEILYLTERNKRTLEDSLFLSNDTLNYHKEEKNAYELLRKSFKIKEDETKEILKETLRSIYVPEPQRIEPPEDQPMAPPAMLQELKLKGEHPAIYWMIKIGA